MSELQANPATDAQSSGTRSLAAIAGEIDTIWTGIGKGVNYAARPYLDAMTHLTTIKDKYMHDDGESIVLYFLSNASTFHGADARRLKLELKAHCDPKHFRR